MRPAFWALRHPLRRFISLAAPSSSAVGRITAYTWNAQDDITSSWDFRVYAAPKPLLGKSRRQRALEIHIIRPRYRSQTASFLEPLILAAGRYLPAVCQECAKEVVKTKVVVHDDLGLFKAIWINSSPIAYLEVQGLIASGLKWTYKYQSCN